MAKIHLLHGIHTSEKNGTVAQLMPYLAMGTGMDVVYHKYGYALALTSRFLNPGRARKIAESVGPDDVLVGHSNGSAIIWEIQQRIKSFKGAVLINAALDRDAHFNPDLKFIHVYYNEDDEAVPLAKFLVAHPWGDMGQHGYGNGAHDHRVRNFDCKRTPRLPEIQGHSEIFNPEKLKEWGPFIARQIKEAL